MEAGVLMDAASYCMNRFQRNIGARLGLSTSQILFSTDMKLNRFEERSLRYCLCSDLCFLCLGLAMSEWSKSRQ